MLLNKEYRKMSLQAGQRCRVFFTEDLDIGPLICGLFVYVPLLWIMKYDSLHSYELERVFVDKQFIPDISNLNDTSIANNDTILVKQDSITEKSEVTDQIIERNDNILAEENDSLAFMDQNALQKDQKKNTLSYFGFGGGFCMPGSVWGLNYTFISSNN